MKQVLVSVGTRAMATAEDIRAIPLSEFLGSAARSSGEESDARLRPPGFDPVFGVPDPEPTEYEPDYLEEPSWRCFRCDIASYRQVGASSWMCYTCGSTSFYDCTAPTRREAESGTWVYVPRGRPSPADSSSTSSSSASTLAAFRPPRTPTVTSSMPTPAVTSLGSRPPAARNPTRGSGPPNGLGETSKSETPAEYQSVDPDNLQPLPRPSRRQRRAAAAAGRGGGQGQGQRSPGEPGADLPEPRHAAGLHDSAGQGGEWRDQMLKDLGDLYVHGKEPSPSGIQEKVLSKVRGGEAEPLRHLQLGATTGTTSVPMTAGNAKSESGNCRCHLMFLQMKPPWPFTSP